MHVCLELGECCPGEAAGIKLDDFYHFLLLVELLLFYFLGIGPVLGELAYVRLA